MKKILVPLDGSELAQSVLPYVAELARCTGAEVELLSAVSEVALWDPNASVVAWSREEQLALGYVESQREGLESNGVKATSHVLRGEPADVIIEEASKTDADLIALSTHGRSGISRWLFGSVTGRVLESTEKPVLVVRPPEEDPGGAIRRILVPLDGSPLAEQVLPLVEEVASACKAKVSVMQAVPPLTAYPGFEAYAPTAMGEVLEDMQARSREYLSKMVDRLKGKKIEAEALTSAALPTEAILAAADQSDADLIAIATHGRSGLGRVVLGSVADAVIRGSHRPCLVVRPKEEEAAGN